MRGSHISLFAGVGMADLALESLGYKTLATAEIDPFCRQVLAARFPDALHFASVENVRYVDGPAEWEAAIQRPLVISGGFPCQDVAASGHGVGLDGARSGLWSEFARIIGEFRPEAVLIENSPMLRSRGLDRVLCDLCSLGYDARWDCVPAAFVGAPHLRDRIWILATPSDPSAALGWSHADYIVRTYHDYIIPGEGDAVKVTKLPRAGKLVGRCILECNPQATVKDSRQRAGIPRWPTPTRSDGTGGPGTSPARRGGKNLRTAVAELEGNGRLNPEWVEWLMGVPCGWTDPHRTCAHVVAFGRAWWDSRPLELRSRTARQGVPNRSQRIRALGNGLVPQAALAAIEILDEKGAIR